MPHHLLPFEYDTVDELVEDCLYQYWDVKFDRPFGDLQGQYGFVVVNWERQTITSEHVSGITFTAGFELKAK